jgi:predicted SprT family Zn-dependent metalloprotease
MTVESVLEMLEKWGLDMSLARERVNHSPHASAILGCAVIFSARMTSTAGRASYFTGSGAPRWIKLSERLFSNGKEAMFEVFTHELAHLLTPGAHHGIAWEMAHRSIGGTAKRCHSYENMARVSRTVKLIAKCRSCGHEYRRVRRLSSNKSYHCHLCGGGLVRY